MRTDKFHGRVTGASAICHAPGCEEPGEFRAPGVRPSGFDGPGDYRWFCLEHVRQFNAGYDFFAGMTPDEILAAQSPLSGWERETRAFRPDAGVDFAPPWGDFADPLEAIAARAKARARWDSVASSPAPLSAASSPATRLFSASCGVSNRKSGSARSLTGSPAAASVESR